MKALFSARLAMLVPKNDFEFFKALIKCGSANQTIFKAIYKKFALHIWFLKEEIVALVSFDENVTFMSRKRR